MNIELRDVTILLLTGALIWALRRPCPDGRRAAERPVSDDNATPEGVEATVHVVRKAS